MAVILSTDAKAVTVQRLGVLSPSGQDGDVANLRQMTREEAPDHPRPDNAHPLHAVARVSRLLTCRSTRTGAPLRHELLELGVGDEAALLGSRPLDRLE